MLICLHDNWLPYTRIYSGSITFVYAKSSGMTQVDSILPVSVEKVYRYGFSSG